MENNTVGMGCPGKILASQQGSVYNRKKKLADEGISSGEETYGRRI